MNFTDLWDYIEGILWVVFLILGIWYTIHLRKLVPQGQLSTEKLSKLERVFLLVMFYFNFLILPLIMYFGLKKRYPSKAKGLILLVLIVILIHIPLWIA